MLTVRTRFSPSPTGSLHIGGVRTALYAYALAKKHNGQFLVRIEDTDQTRFVEGAENEVYEALTAYGIEWDETYKQSERLAIYKEHAEILVNKGAAYYCFATKEELDEQRKIAEANGEKFKFKSPFRDIDLEDAKKRIAAGEKYVVRLKTPPDREIMFDDALQGKMKFNTNDIDDTVLLKSDGFPTYHLAVVVDDYLMKISHVFRGVEWIPSIPKHVLIYEGFGWEMPIFAHLSLILDPEGGKLSKRKGTVAALGFLKEGYLPEAVLNFLMLLGWSSPEERKHGESEREIYSKENFVELFEIKNLNKSSPVFDRTKLIWFNQKYIQSYTPDILQNKFTEWLRTYHAEAEKDLIDKIIINGPDYLQEAILLEQTRIKLFSDLLESIKLFYFRGEKIEYAEVKQLKDISTETFKSVLQRFLEFVETKDFPDLSHEEWEQKMRQIGDDLSIKHGQGFMALRVAVTDSPFSPPLFETIKLLGKEETTARINRYL